MRGDEEIDDLSLLARSAQGDQAAFAALLTRHEAAVLRLARALTDSQAQAEDVVQETFLAAFQHGATFQGGPSARAWLLSIARRAALRTHRRRAGEPRPADLQPLDALGQAAGWGDDDPEAAVAQHEAHELMRAALDALAPEDREVLLLRDVEGLSGQDAARLLDLPLTTMKMRLHRARLRLMAALRAGDTHGA